MFAAASVGLDLDNLSRLALSATCTSSMLAAICLAWITHPRYTPHMILVAFWSLWAATGMAYLAAPGVAFPFIPDDWIVLNLNGSFIVTVGGWALFVVRLVAHGHLDPTIVRAPKPKDD